MQSSVRTSSVLAALALVAGLFGGIPARAGHNDDDHSDNIEKVGQADMLAPGEGEPTKAQGSDLAIRKDNVLIAGSYSHGFAVYKMLKRQPYLKQLSIANCPGPQGDVSVSGDLVFVSVDTAQKSEECGSGAATQADLMSGNYWEGVRVFSIANLRRPTQVAAIKTPCGSHTHTLSPAGKQLFLYVSSYPLSGQGPDCNYASHRRVTVWDVPLSDPAKTEQVGEVSVSPAIGCHDITTFPAKKLAFAACVSESQVWDISNPAQPEILSRIRNPLINIHHSTAMTWDGKYIIIGDEFSGAVGNGCLGDEDVPVGAMWFYDISDPASPQEVGYFGPPRRALPRNPSEAEYSRCTNHNFNVLPMKDPKRYIVTNSYYTAGLNVIDFSDPANPEEVAHYVPMVGESWPSLWAAYWYNGRIYANDFEAEGGVSVYEVDGFGRKEVKFFKQGLNPQVQIPEFK